MVSGLFSPGRGSTGLGPTQKLVTRKEGTSIGTQKLRVHTYHCIIAIKSYLKLYLL